MGCAGQEAQKNAKKAAPAPQTTKERTEAGEKKAAQQTGLGLGGKKQTFETAEKLQAGLPHRGPKVEAKFNKYYGKFREELKTQLAVMTYSKIGEDSAKIMDDASKTQSFIPNFIFVG